MIAGPIYRLAARRGGPFVRLNCTAIPAGLVESELFGHEPGAFTGGIARRIGRFELATWARSSSTRWATSRSASNRSCFACSRHASSSGSAARARSGPDTRVIAATNRPPEELVEAGQCGADLFYRLNVFPIDLPPLRARRDDIPLLVRHFVAHHARSLGRRIDAIPI
jgi:formate hydrogenlyase transcriptional activator